MSDVQSTERMMSIGGKRTYEQMLDGDGPSTSKAAAADASTSVEDMKTGIVYKVLM